MTQPTARDRRSRVRFPINLPFFYRTMERPPRTGNGRILNISSKGVMAACYGELDTDTTIELTIEWPARLNEMIPLCLIVVGTIVRCETSGFAMAGCRHRFEIASPAYDRRRAQVSERADSDETEMRLYG